MINGPIGDFQLNDRQFIEHVEKFSKISGIAIKEVIWDQHRLWLSDVIKRIPPRTLKQGRNAIDNDLRRIFVPMRDAQALKYMYDRFGPRLENKTGVKSQPVQFDIFDPKGNLVDMRQHHISQRGANGRVTKAGTFTHNIGRWKFPNKMHVKQSAFKKYLKQVQSHVGIMKAGFIPAAKLFGSKIPKFVARHGSGQGSGRDAMDKYGNGYLEAINRVPYAYRQANGIVEFTLKNRKLDMKRKLKRKQKELAKEFSQQRTPGP